MEEGEPKLYEDELEDEWARIIRDDEEAMLREMEEGMDEPDTRKEATENTRREAERSTRNDGGRHIQDGEGMTTKECQKEINEGLETQKSANEVQTRDRELQMWEEDLEDEWERNIRDDEEAMVREMEIFHTWIEEEEYKIDRDRFGDG